MCLATHVKKIIVTLITDTYKTWSCTPEMPVYMETIPLTFILWYRFSSLYYQANLYLGINLPWLYDSKGEWLDYWLYDQVIWCIGIYFLGCRDSCYISNNNLMSHILKGTRLIFHLKVSKMYYIWVLLTYLFIKGNSFSELI